MGQSTSKSFSGGASPGRSATERGLIVSVISSLCFAGIYFITPTLAPASAESLWGIRNLFTLPLILLTLAAFRQQQLIADIWIRLRRRPVLIVPILICGLLVAAQLWVFSWAPLHGRGLHVALGYFLLPLILVIVGRFLYRDTLLWWHWLAAGVAAVGVVWEIIRVGSVSWETLLVALGYPVYFVLRRALNINHLGGMFWEFLVLAPFALWLVIAEVTNGRTLAENPALMWLAPAFALWSGFALICYLLASRFLSISIFGLMSYLEPALLVVASLLIGERIASGEWPMYMAVWGAVLILVVGGTVQLVRSSRGKRRGGPDAQPPGPPAG
ncbi:EamA family transporter RarD [Leucobacter aridicollis]|uniref:Chloramphenicol-sensitive protein RarD n=1 Tax=Leucobacter aridicollis TaxID=283878 RepID=A0A852RFC9_9MICO|nr:EamA family transporter RarD [Leucobacter aridicollis]MBL3683181.1 EamA family transporter RarD [Leucobacter aridicollis]NYD25412.1 chloramphenicol-sensitive protein RarD [Leucobacter aridicollis]